MSSKPATAAKSAKAQSDPLAILAAQLHLTPAALQRRIEKGTITLVDKTKQRTQPFPPT